MMAILNNFSLVEFLCTHRLQDRESKSIMYTAYCLIEYWFLVNIPVRHIGSEFILL